MRVTLEPGPIEECMPHVSRVSEILAAVKYHGW